MCTIKFYDNSIFSGTKMLVLTSPPDNPFYDNSIFSGTKIKLTAFKAISLFYDNSIFSGTKINKDDPTQPFGFTITQFFQVLKLLSLLVIAMPVLR